MRTLRDTWLIFHRSLVLTIRQPIWIIFGIMYPVLYLVLFGPLLDGAVRQAGSGRQRLQLVRAGPPDPGRPVRDPRSSASG